MMATNFIFILIVYSLHNQTKPTTDKFIILHKTALHCCILHRNYIRSFFCFTVESSK